MRRFSLFIALGVIVSFAVVGPSFSAKGGYEQRGPANSTFDGPDQWDKECDDDDSTDDSIDFVGDTNQWPPNHRAVPSDIFARGDTTDTVSLTLVASSNDSFESSDFGYSTTTVSNGTVRADVTTVRERSGGSDQIGANSGRRYEITATATFSDGSACVATFCVRIPHDMRPENRTFVPCQQTAYPDNGAGGTDGAADR